MPTNIDKPAASPQQKQRGRPFRKGESGNPRGKAPGTRNKATVAAEALLEGESAELTRICIEAAKGGDMTAMRLCMERAVPIRRGRPVSFQLPAAKSPNEIVDALGAILAAVAVGALTPEEAEVVARIFEAQRKTLELVEIEQRLARLERRTEEEKRLLGR